MNRSVEVHSLIELEQFWKELLPSFPDRCVLLLKGDVGAGKTHSVLAIAQLQGLKDVASPSFAIHHRYEGQNGFVLDHLDLFRLKNEDDLESTGFWDLFAQKKSLIIIEWPQRLNFEELPMNWRKVQVEISILGPTDRRIDVTDLGF